MMRLVLSLVLSVSVARWIYSEVKLIAPPIVPLIDFVVDATALPTHDQWSKDSVQQLLALVETASGHLVASTGIPLQLPTKQTVQKVSAPPRIRSNRPLDEVALQLGLSPRGTISQASTPVVYAATENHKVISTL